MTRVYQRQNNILLDPRWLVSWRASAKGTFQVKGSDKARFSLPSPHFHPRWKKKCIWYPRYNGDDIRTRPIEKATQSIFVSWIRLRCNFSWVRASWLDIIFFHYIFFSDSPEHILASITLFPSKRNFLCLRYSDRATESWLPLRLPRFFVVVVIRDSISHISRIYVLLD